MHFFLIEALSLWDDIHLDICVAPVKNWLFSQALVEGGYGALVDC